MKNKKASTPLAVTILVFVTFLLTMLCLSYYINKKNMQQEDVSLNIKIMEHIYNYEELFNYCLGIGLTPEQALNYLDNAKIVDNKYVEIDKIFEINGERNFEVIYRFEIKPVNSAISSGSTTPKAIGVQP